DFWAVGDLLGNKVDAEARLVDGDRLAVPIDDPAAPWRHRDELDPVAFAQQLVLLVLGNSEPAHPADQGRSDRRLRPAQQHHPAREGNRLMRSGDAHVFHRPSLQASIRDTIQAKAGKTQMEMTSAGSMRVNEGAASSN